MKYFKIIIVFKICVFSVLLLFLTSCYKHQCENRGGDCPPYPHFIIKPLSYSIGDSIRFKNDFGTKIGFRVDSYRLFHDTEFGCEQTGDLSCHCQSCNSFQEIRATTMDEPWPLIDSKRLRLQDGSGNDEGIFDDWNTYYQVFDASNSGHSYSPNFPLSDEFYKFYEMGGIVYRDVYIVDDTSETMSKVYISMDKGIIGFDENQTPSTFYLVE